MDTLTFQAPLKLTSIKRHLDPEGGISAPYPMETPQQSAACPLSGGMLSNIEVQHPTTVMGKDHQNEQHSESHRRHHKEIDRHQVFDMMVQKHCPCRRRRLLGPHSLFLYGEFGNINSEFPQLPDNPGQTPSGIDFRHLTDQHPDFLGYRRSTLLTQLSPITTKAFPLPGDHSPGLDKDERTPPIRPPAREARPQHAVYRLNPRA